MAIPGSHPPPFTVSNRTLIAVRWAAIFGQIFAIFMGRFVLQIELPMTEVSACVLLSLFINLFAIVTHGRRRLSENAATTYLAVDIVQFAMQHF